MNNVDLLRSLSDAFGRGEIPTVLGTISPDIKWFQAESNPYHPSGEPWVGPDAVLNNLFMRIGAGWAPFIVDVKAIYGAGDTVVAEVRYRGNYTPTGKRLDCQACHVWDVEGGKVTRFQQYVDTAKLQDVLGVAERR